MINRFENEYAFLSNFYYSPITIDNYTYYHVEGAFQALKMKHPEDHNAVGAAVSPSIAKKIGRQRQCRPDWDEVRLDVMETCLRAKFAPGSFLANKLIATGDEELIEGNDWGDVYWGVDKDLGGQNHLGLLLMKLRSELQQNSELDTTNKETVHKHWVGLPYHTLLR